MEHRLAGVVGSLYTAKTVGSPTAIQLSIDGLVMFTEYAIRVQAYNDAGGGPFSTPIRVVTGEAGKNIMSCDLMKMEETILLEIRCTVILNGMYNCLSELL